MYKYEIISHVEQDISLVALLTREISWLTLKIDFIFPHIHALLVVSDNTVCFKALFT